MSYFSLGPPCRNVALSLVTGGGGPLSWQARRVHFRLQNPHRRDHTAWRRVCMGRQATHAQPARTYPHTAAAAAQEVGLAGGCFSALVVA